MTFPTGVTISTDNLDSPDDDPSLARADLLSLVQTVNQLIDSENSTNGVLTLDSNGRISTTYLPSTVTVTGNLQLQPSTKIVNVRDVLRLQQRYTADNSQLTTSSAGDMIYLVDGDAGTPCLGVYDGTVWRVVRFMTQVGAVGAALASTFTMAAEAD